MLSVKNENRGFEYLLDQFQIEFQKQQAELKDHKHRLELMTKCENDQRELEKKLSLYEAKFESLANCPSEVKIDIKTSNQKTQWKDKNLSGSYRFYAIVNKKPAYRVSESVSFQTILNFV